ncbi:hypothetical protein SEA_HUCKLEBERRY_61 [Arthrobacter phage Huckleberry]|nr:hypothetical protein SEA_HUCKLEBERRY_61 [Arthrobacter phage Huckleberry]
MYVYCWEDDHGCICGNECEPPKWMQEMWAAEEGMQSKPSP